MKENVRIKDKWKKRNLIAHDSRVHVCNGSGSLSTHLPTRAEQGEQWRHTVAKRRNEILPPFLLVPAPLQKLA